MGDVALPQVGDDERDNRRPGWYAVKTRARRSPLGMATVAHYFVERGGSMCGRHRDGYQRIDDDAMARGCDFQKCKACAKIAQPKSTTEAQRAQR